MADMSRPKWLGELINVVQLLCPAGAEAVTAKGSSTAKKLGRVLPDAEKGDGWFWLDLAGRPADSDQLENAYLASGESGGRRRYQLIEAVQDGNLLKLRVGAHAPRDGLSLWVPTRARWLLERSLVDGLSRINHFELINHFDSGRLEPAPADADVPPGIAAQDRLNSRQMQALAVSRAPGVHLVWGPPGTGKTKVIALALQDLASHGKSVLLVSHTNVAVDNALGSAAQSLDPAPGVMVRAGTPQVQEVADDSRICLQKMTYERQEALDQQRRLLEEQITACRFEPSLTRLAEAREELAGFDNDAYQRALERLGNESLLADKITELRQAQQQAAAAAEAARIARQRLDKARKADQEARPAREHIRRAHDLAVELKDRKLDRDRAAADALRVDGEHDRLTGALGEAAGLRRMRERKRLSGLIAQADHRMAAARTRSDEAGRLFSALCRQLRPEIEAHYRAAHPWTPETLATLDADLAAAEVASQQAETASEVHKQQEVTAQEQADHGRRQPQPESTDIEIVSRARDRNLPRKLADLPALQQSAKSTLALIERLEEQHEKILAEVVTQGRRVRQEIIKNASVVATTLALLRITPDLHEREYDHVIVDEVAAACPPEVVYAASRAREGVTLFGDFLQNGPIVPEKFRRSDNPEIQRWYHQDCFALFGIIDPAAAEASPGCVILTKQYRFGQVINDLANEVAYRGVLEVAGDDMAGDEGTVVLIDVDGLGDDLAHVRPGPGGSGRWWPVGALVAHALATQYISMVDQTGEAGIKKAAIITPYSAQQDLIQNVLSESGASPRIEAGTSHRFQGREFDTLIFDLVEDGTGWIARGRLHAGSFELGGLRVFNVGATRTRRRLYLIANGAAIQRATAGPLRALRNLQSTGHMHIVRAAEVLDLPREPVDAIAGEVWQALRGHANLIDLYDEDHLPEELSQRIDQAQERIWLWSPWVGRRSEQLLPHLRGAADRGVGVNVVILPPGDVNQHLRSRHEELAKQIPNVIFLRKEHQKLIIIDRRLTFIGSMNVLAHPQGGRHEVMALFEGSWIVERMLEHERADELARPPTCPQCNRQVTMAAARGGRDGEGRLHWRCRTITPNGKQCNWTRPFPDRPGTRNQAR